MIRKTVALTAIILFSISQMIQAAQGDFCALRPLAAKETKDAIGGVPRRDFLKTGGGVIAAAALNSVAAIAGGSTTTIARAKAASRARRAKNVRNIRAQQARIFNNYALTARVAYDRLDTEYHKGQVKKGYEHEIVLEAAAIESGEGAKVARVQEKMLSALGDYLKAEDEATRTHQFADVNGTIQAYFDAEIAYLKKIEEYNKKQEENSHRSFRNGIQSRPSHESVRDIRAISAAKRLEMEEWRQIYADMALIGAPLPAFHIIPVTNFKAGVWNAISQLVNPNPLTDSEEIKRRVKRIESGVKKILETECGIISADVRVKQRYVKWLEDNIGKKYVSGKQLKREKQILAAQESAGIVKIGLLCAQINQIDGGGGLFDALNFAIFKHMDVLVEKAKSYRALSDEDARWTHDMFRKGFMSAPVAAAAGRKEEYDAAVHRIAGITRALAGQYSAMGFVVPAQTTKAPAVKNLSSVHEHLPHIRTLTRFETSQETQARAHRHGVASDKVFSGPILADSTLGAIAANLSITEEFGVPRDAVKFEGHELLGRGSADFGQFVPSSAVPIKRPLLAWEVEQYSSENRKLVADQLDELARRYSITEEGIRASAEWTLRTREYFTSEEEREDARDQLLLAKVMRHRIKLLGVEKDVINLKEETPEYAHAREDYDGTVMAILGLEHSRLAKRLGVLKKRHEAMHKLFRGFLGNDFNLMYKDADIEECQAALNQVEAQTKWFGALRDLELPLGSPDFSPSSLMPIKILQRIPKKGVSYARFHGHVKRVEEDGSESRAGITSVSKLLPLGNVVYISSGNRRLGERTKYVRAPNKDGFMPRSRIVRVSCDLLALLPGAHPDSIGPVFIETEAVIPRLQMESGIYRVVKIGDFYGVSEDQPPALLGADAVSPELDIVAQPAYDVVTINGDDCLVQVGVFVRRARRPHRRTVMYTFEPDINPKTLKYVKEDGEFSYGRFAGDGDVIDDFGRGRKLTVRIVKSCHLDGTPYWSVQYDGVIRKPEKIERKKAPQFSHPQDGADANIKRQFDNEIETEWQSIAEVYGLDIRFSNEFGVNELHKIIRGFRKGLDLIDKIDGGIVRNATTLPTRHAHIYVDHGSLMVKIDGVRDSPPIAISSGEDVHDLLWREIIASYLAVSRLPGIERLVWDQLVLPEAGDSEEQFKNAVRVYLELEPFAAGEETDAGRLRQRAYVRSLLRDGLEGRDERAALLDERKWNMLKVGLATAGIAAGKVALDLLIDHLLASAGGAAEQKPRPRTQEMEYELEVQKCSFKNL